MKTCLIVMAALMAMVVGSPSAVLADPQERGFGGGRYFDRMTEVLDLTEEQQARIKEIRSEEWAAIAPLWEQLEESRERLHELAKTHPFDEAAVRKLAAGQADIRTEMIVARARMMNRTLAVLTPEQQELAEKLRPMKKERGGHRKGAPRGPE